MVRTTVAQVVHRCSGQVAITGDKDPHAWQSWDFVTEKKEDPNR
jgi:hypothetical protein